MRLELKGNILISEVWDEEYEMIVVKTLDSAG